MEELKSKVAIHKAEQAKKSEDAKESASMAELLQQSLAIGDEVMVVEDEIISEAGNRIMFFFSVWDCFQLAFISCNIAQLYCIFLEFGRYQHLCQQQSLNLVRRVLRAEERATNAEGTLQNPQRRPRREAENPKLCHLRMQVKIQVLLRSHLLLPRRLWEDQSLEQPRSKKDCVLKLQNGSTV